MDRIIEVKPSRPDAPTPGFTPGPWKWRWPSGSRGGPVLVAAHSGMLLVLDAVRDGMQSATLRFARRGENDRGGLMFKSEEFVPDKGAMRPDYQTPTNPDMRLIEAAPDLYAALERLLRANESDNEQCPDMDVRTAFETNSQAVAQARAALSAARGEGRGT